MSRGKTATIVSCALLICYVPVLAITIDTVPVGNPGNTGELSGEGAGGFGPDRICGAVDYTYNIGKYPVTAGQYTAFLNVVAATDPYGLYSTSMWTHTYGCKIQRHGTSGSYTYSVAGDYANRPVNYVSWGDSARFANWLHHGKPEGSDTWITETGAYTLNGAMTNEELMAVTRNADWQWAITSEDEWYKAAYHKNDGVTGNYWGYPTRSNTINTSMANYAGSIGHATHVGSYPYPSPYGTFDQGGNVWEWNEAVIGSSRGLRGGSFYTSDFFLRASFRDIFDYPSSVSYHFGFRVSEVPEPGSALLLLIGCAGMVLRRRRI